MKSTSVGPALTRPVGKAGDAHDPRSGLNRHVHRQIVAVRPADAKARAGGVDQPWVDLMQPAPADAELVHRAGREILEQHIGALDHAEQQLAAARVLQIQRNRVLILVEHGEGQARTLARLGAAPPGLAARRLDLDDERACLREQQAGIGTLKDLAEIDHGHIRQRPPLNHRFFAPHRIGNFNRGSPARESC